MIEQVFTFKRTAALCLVGAFCSLNAQAQKITVKGSIVDGTGEPLIGATVKVKGNASSGAVIGEFNALFLQIFFDVFFQVKSAVIGAEY